MAKHIKIKNTETGEVRSVYAPDAREWMRLDGWVPDSGADQAALDRKPTSPTPEQALVDAQNPKDPAEEPPAPADVPRATRGGSKGEGKGNSS